MQTFYPHNLVKSQEFSPEMKHIRIDTIAKDKNGKPTIERVRVIPEAKQ